MDWMTIFAVAVIQAVATFWVDKTVRKPMEETEKLKSRLDRVEADRLAKIEENTEKIEKKIDNETTRIEKKIDDHELDGGIKRKKIYETIEKVREEYVRITSCDKMHIAMTEQFNKFSSSVIDLAHVQEKTELVSKRIEKVSEQVIALGQDISKMEGRHDGRG